MDPFDGDGPLAVVPVAHPRKARGDGVAVAGDAWFHVDDDELIDGRQLETACSSSLINATTRGCCVDGIGTLSAVISSRSSRLGA